MTENEEKEMRNAEKRYQVKMHYRSIKDKETEQIEDMKE